MCSGVFCLFGDYVWKEGVESDDVPYLNTWENKRIIGEESTSRAWGKRVQ